MLGIAARQERKPMSPSHLRRIFIASTLSCAAAFCYAQGARQERVSFKPGSSSATVSGAIQGDQIVEYVLGAKAGQTMTVSMKTSNGANYFNVLPPGSDAAIAIGSTVGTKWSGTLPASGDYRISVYLMRSAARRNETAKYTLTVGISGKPGPAAGARYNATGKVPCSVGPDPKGSAQCSFGVIRRGPGQADVYLASPGFDVTLHNNDLRQLQFAGNTVKSANPKEKVTSTRQGDNWLIGVDNFNFYTIPDAVINGG
jgi:hypothetical protein